MAEAMGADDDPRPVEWRELAPGNVLKGLFRRIDRTVKVRTHDKPEPKHAEAETTSPSKE